MGCTHEPQAATLLACDEDFRYGQSSFGHQSTTEGVVVNTSFDSLTGARFVRK